MYKKIKSLAILAILSFSSNIMTGQDLHSQGDLFPLLKYQYIISALSQGNNAVYKTTQNPNYTLKSSASYMDYNGTYRLRDSAIHFNRPGEHSLLEGHSIYYPTGNYSTSIIKNEGYLEFLIPADSSNHYTIINDTVRFYNKTHWLYNSSGQSLGRQTYYYDDQEKGKLITYDNQGRVIKSVAYNKDASGTITNTDTMFVSYHTGNPNYIIIKDQNGFKDSLLLDAQNQITHMYDFSGNNKISRITEYSYDSHGAFTKLVHTKVLGFNYVDSIVTYYNFNPAERVYDYIETQDYSRSSKKMINYSVLDLILDNGALDSMYYTIWNKDSIQTSRNIIKFNLDANDNLTLRAIYSTQTGALLREDYFYYENVITGLKELKEKQMTIEVFPNPSASVYTVSAQRSIHSIEVYDMLGKLRMNGNFSGARKLSLDLGDLSAGNYILHVRSDDGYFSSHSISKL